MKATFVVVLIFWAAGSQAHSYQAYSCDGPGDAGSPHGAVNTSSSPFSLTVTGTPVAGTTVGITLGSATDSPFIGFLIVSGAGNFTSIPSGIAKHVTCPTASSGGRPGSGSPTSPSATKPTYAICHTNPDPKTSIATSLQLPTSGVSTIQLKYYIMAAKVNTFWGPLYQTISVTGGSGGPGPSSSPTPTASPPQSGQSPSSVAVKAAVPVAFVTLAAVVAAATSLFA